MRIHPLILAAVLLLTLPFWLPFIGADDRGAA